MIRRYRSFSPKIHKKAYVDDSAIVIGDVEIGENSSVWPGVVIRGDRDKISIGKYTNIQDNATIHNTRGFPVYIGDYVSIGHSA
jgi:carbonic anhydrase/acetyltransferase-like protein (isoleucine patch superfamily)